MGTNFYDAIKSPVGVVSEGRHIGKRSAAGLYCWNCKLTLCRGGKEAVHTGGSRFIRLFDSNWAAERAKGWYDACPGCGQREVSESLEESSAGRELGFNKSSPRSKDGVASCSSFCWAVPPGAIEGIGEIVDEYGRLFSLAEFIQVLEECPIQYTDLIGRDFS